MPRKIQTDSENILDTIRGSVDRKLDSWIESFVAETENLEAPKVWRRWAAISLIAAALEQRVWVQTSSPLYPNLYVMIVGHPGTGKTRTMRVIKRLALTLSEFSVAPISLTFASLVDYLAQAQRSFQVPGQVDPIQFNSCFICAEELGAFMHRWDDEMIKGLSAFYDPDPYAQHRRTNDLKIAIDSPQVNMCTGVTPQDLLKLLPEVAWGQGFTSRTIMVFSDERIIGNDFAPRADPKLDALEHDLKVIHGLYGQFHVTNPYMECIANWRALGEPPVPNHPKLTHYITRRRVHLYKLSMVSAIDRGNSLTLTTEDFNRAMNWLVEVESWMPEIFKAGQVNADAQAMEEIAHFVMAADRGEGVHEARILREASKHIAINSLPRLLETMCNTGQIYSRGMDSRTGYHRYSAGAGTPILN